VSVERLEVVRFGPGKEGHRSVRIALLHPRLPEFRLVRTEGHRRLPALVEVVGREGREGVAAEDDGHDCERLEKVYGGLLRLLRVLSRLVEVCREAERRRKMTRRRGRGKGVRALERVRMRREGS
jgi:hypothetical protein